MESNIEGMQKTIEELVKVNSDLTVWKQEYNSHKQSLARLSTRLRKLCKKLTPSSEIVIEMQQIANEIRDLLKLAMK